MEEQRLLDEETFDFDFDLSPATRNGDIAKDSDDIDDESEVFFGPVGFTERCRAAAVVVDSKVDKSFSPLNPTQLAELVKEANTVAFRILQTQPSSSLEDSVGSHPKTGSTSSSDSVSPFKPHSRTSTFTVNKENLCLLSRRSRKCLSVMDTDDDPDQAHVRKSYRCGIAESSLLPKNRSRTNLNKTFSNESLDSGFSKKSNFSSAESDDAYETCSVKSDNSDVSLSKIPLSRPKPVVSGTSFGRMSKMQPPLQKNKSSLERSFVKPLGNSSKSNMNRSLNVSSYLDKSYSRSTSNSNGVLHKKSAIKSKLANPKGNSYVKAVYQDTKLNQLKMKAPGSVEVHKVPATKLQLLHPGQLQRRTLGSNTQCNIRVATGPMKATDLHLSHQNKTASGKELRNLDSQQAKWQVTPIKPEKKVQPKNLITNCFATPKKKDSTSSVESLHSSTPASAAKRRSFLPTPTKSRIGSIPSPASHSSVSSLRSMSDCDTDHSVFDDNAMFSESKVLSSTLDGIDDRSPSGMLAKNPKVVHTPNLPVRRTSKWSPVSRPKAMNIEEQAFLCTKRTLSK